MPTIEYRLAGLTVEQAYELGRSDGRSEIQEAINASEEEITDFIPI